MPLVDTKKMFHNAFKGNYAIGAFNINNLEVLQGVARAAKAKNTAVIIAVSKSALEYAGSLYLKGMVEAAAKEAGVDMALHLDHGADLETVKMAVKAGCTSIMYDGSHLDFEENIRTTKEVVDFCHPLGIPVEAELGQLAGIEDEVSIEAHAATLTDPDQALEFVTRTGVDSLAIAIGTSHGAYKFSGAARLDFDRLERITEKLEAAGFHSYPIVLHGASSVDPSSVALNNAYGGEIHGAKGIPEDMLQRAAKMAVCKVNMDTDLRLAMTAAVRESLAKNPKNFDPRKYLGAGRDLIQQIVERKIDEVLGSSNSMDR